jgi:hypothetical protein
VKELRNKSLHHLEIVGVWYVYIKC